MFKSKLLPLLGGAAVAAAVTAPLAIAPPAHADLMFSFDTYTGSGTPPAGPYGSVTLHQNGANVDVSVALAAGEGFVNTGAGAALTWDLVGNPVVTITNLDLTNFSVSHNGTSTGNLDGTGSWFYEIDCTDAGCGSGGSHPNPGPLTFTILDITTSDFIINNKVANGYMFASDICTRVAAESGCAGITGDIAAPGTPVATPEPAALSVLGAALMGFVAVRRRRLD